MSNRGTSSQVKAALHAGSVLPVSSIDLLLGLRTPALDEVVFVRPGECGPASGPFLRLRPPVRGRNAGTWYIEDRTSPIEREYLGREDRRLRRSTGFKEGDERQAALRLLFHVEMQRARLLGTVLPTQVSVATILRAYLEHLDGDTHGLCQSTVYSYRQCLTPVVRYFGGMRLGGVDAESCSGYRAWRLAQDAAPNGYRPRTPRKVSLTTVAHELGTLKRAINAFHGRARLNLVVDVPVPSTPKPPVTWLRRAESARYLWAMRGRIWNVEAGRWRVMRDDDPTLSDPEGSLRVLRPPEVREHRRGMARIFLLGIYTGGRHTSLIQGTYAEADRASVDWSRGVLDRRAMHAPQTSKRQPSVLLPPKVGRFVHAWARQDRAKGITHLVHRMDGQAYARRLAAKYWRQLDADAGVGKHVTVHVLRHTCAMWLKGEGVPIWSAANYLGCSTKVLEHNYGTWDMHSQVEAVAALSRMSRHRAAELLLRGMPTG